MGRSVSNLKSICGLLALSLIGSGFCSGCAKSQPANNVLDQASLVGGIVGGVAVSELDPIARSTVAIYDSQQKTICTGSILSNQIVVTAAHCANQNNPTALVLLFGVTLPNVPGAKYSVRRVSDLRVHPHYMETMAALEKNSSTNPDVIRDWGDISLLKFDGGLPPGYQPVAIMPTNAVLKNGMVVTLAGYGEINGRLHQTAKGLNKVQVTIANANFAPSEVLMDQRNGRGACHGDSGGPAYVTGANGQLFLFGATSRLVNDPGNTCSAYTVFSKIQSPAMAAFINQASADLTKPKGNSLRTGIWKF